MVQDKVKEEELEATSEEQLLKLLNNKLFKWMYSGLNLNTLELGKGKDCIV